MVLMALLQLLALELFLLAFLVLFLDIQLPFPALHLEANHRELPRKDYFEPIGSFVLPMDPALIER